MNWMTPLQVSGAVAGTLTLLLGVLTLFRKPRNHAHDERWREDKDQEPLAQKDSSPNQPSTLIYKDGRFFRFCSECGQEITDECYGLGGHADLRFCTERCRKFYQGVNGL